MKIVPIFTIVGVEGNEVICTDIVRIETKLGFSKTIKSTAKAKCHPDDTFDKVKGERLARSRAQYKNYTKAQKLIMNLYTREVDEYLGDLDRITELIYKEFKHTKELEK
jgi:hypothetical protein